jgi:hypothetical protein
MELNKERVPGKVLPLLAALVPHRDARLAARAYSGALFSAGVLGAWSFPWVIPLAFIKKSFTRDELKKLAGDLRALSISGGGDGMIRADGEATIPFIKGYDLYGLNMDPGFSPELFTPVKDNVISVFPRPVLGAALVHPPDAGTPELRGRPRTFPPVPACPEISFRAAYAANIIYRPLSTGEAYSFEWIIGRPAWLPRVKKRRNAGG